jgi:hypothetical protein
MCVSESLADVVVRPPSLYARLRACVMREARYVRADQLLHAVLQAERLRGVRGQSSSRSEVIMSEAMTDAHIHLHDQLIITAPQMSLSVRLPVCGRVGAPCRPGSASSRRTCCSDNAENIVRRDADRRRQRE